MPAIAVVATATYSGAFAAGLEPWAKALMVGAGPLVLHGIAPLLDWLVGQKPHPALPAGARVPPADDLRARLLPTLCIASHFAAALFCYSTISASAASASLAATAAATAQPSWLLPLLVLTLATSAATAMAASHELVHSRNPAHLGAAAAFLTAHWWYPYYRAHHQHHLHVATPPDYSCAGRGLDVYTYMARYLTGSYAEAWHLAVEECKRTGKAVFSWHNSTLVAYAAQAAITAAIWVAFGPTATAVHLAVSAVILLYITLLDYALHYGLYRPPMPGSERRFTPITPYTSWNSLYPVENALLFNVLVHSDHHLYGNKSYGWLRPPAALPTFPGPINLVGLSALVPPLWRALMDSRADEANARNLEYLGLAPAT